MAWYYLVEHADWDEPRKIYHGPNSNNAGLCKWMNQTFGSSPECAWQLPDESLPDIVAFLAHVRYRRNYLCELDPEDYGTKNPKDFEKNKPILLKVAENFEVAGYTFLKSYDVDVVNDNTHPKFLTSTDVATEIEDKHPDRIRAMAIKLWDGHMSPGDYEGYERDRAAHEAYKNGEDVYEIIRKERERERE